MASDQLRRSQTYKDLPPASFSPKTLRRQAIARASPHYMSHEEFQRCRQPFPAPVVSKLPLSHRALSPASLLQQLEREELSRMIADFPSHRDDFRAGDRVCVTKYISLSDKSRVDRVFGIVIARRGGTGLSASFTLRNLKLDEAFELQLPLWSPFIVRIDLLERSHMRHKKSKLYWLRQRDRKEWETHLHELLPKTAQQKRVILRGSPMFEHEERRKMEDNRRVKQQARDNRATAKQLQQAEKEADV